MKEQRTLCLERSRMRNGRDGGNKPGMIHMEEKGKGEGGALRRQKGRIRTILEEGIAA